MEGSSVNIWTSVLALLASAARPSRPALSMASHLRMCAVSGVDMVETDFSQRPLISRTSEIRFLWIRLA